MVQTSLEFLRKQKQLIAFILVVLVVRVSFADQYVVPTGSMIPTIHIGDRLFVNKMAYDLKFPLVESGLLKISDPKPGDVVVLRSPENSLTLVKRLIGVPGDHIRIRDGFIEVNGAAVPGSEIGLGKLEAVEEGSQANGSAPVFYREQLGQHSFTVQRLPEQINHAHLEFDVPPDRYFFMGDNRDNSYDSRGWGFAPRENIKGKALYVAWNAQIFSMQPSVDLARFGKKLD